MKPLAIFLGVFSIGLGAIEVFAPEKLERFLGAGNKNVVRACGVREIVNGVGVIAMPRSSTPLWLRVAGDALDLVLLGASAKAGDKKHIAVAAASVAAVTVLDVVAAKTAAAKKAC